VRLINLSRLVDWIAPAQTSALANVTRTRDPSSTTVKECAFRVEGPVQPMCMLAQNTGQRGWQSNLSVDPAELEPASRAKAGIPACANSRMVLLLFTSRIRFLYPVHNGLLPGGGHFWDCLAMPEPGGG
jgi:hypothetical protein